jgi:pimeloyl-ACP methyl ester carboxylesterase
MPSLTVADAEVHYLERGAGDPLVLVHGFAGTGEASWAGVLPALAERYRVLAPDARGHGRSTGGAEVMGHARAAADLVALLDHLGRERAHFVGHSGGGLLLLALGMRHRARARTLTVGAFCVSTGVGEDAGAGRARRLRSRQAAVGGDRRKIERLRRPGATQPTHRPVRLRRHWERLATGRTGSTWWGRGGWHGPTQAEGVPPSAPTAWLVAV